MRSQTSINQHQGLSAPQTVWRAMARPRRERARVAFCYFLFGVSATCARRERDSGHVGRSYAKSETSTHCLWVRLLLGLPFGSWSCAVRPAGRRVRPGAAGRAGGRVWFIHLNFFSNCYILADGPTCKLPNDRMAGGKITKNNKLLIKRSTAQNFAFLGLTRGTRDETRSTVCVRPPDHPLRCWAVPFRAVRCS